MSIRESVAFHEDGYTVRREQDVADIVDHAKARHNEGLHGFPDFKLAAIVPVIVVEHYCNVHGVTADEFHRNPEHMRRILNDPAFADLRVAPGKV